MTMAKTRWHIKVALRTQGPLPHPCYWCEEPVRVLGTTGRSGVVHHVDHDPANNEPSNLVFAHNVCHITYHHQHPAMRLRKSERMRHLLAQSDRPQAKCPNCGRVSTPGPMARHIASMSCQPAEFVHGSVSTYTNRRCRCEQCREAMRAHRMARLDRLSTANVQHGSASTYKNWNCRCRACTDAATALARQRRARAKETKT